MGKQEQSSADARNDWRYFTQDSLERRAQDARELLRAFAAHVESAREAQRTCIARDLHDQPGQASGGPRMAPSRLEKRLPGDLAAPAALRGPKAPGLPGIGERARLCENGA